MMIHASYSHVYIVSTLVNKEIMALYYGSENKTTTIVRVAIEPYSRPVVPNLFDIREWFCGRQFFHGPGQQGMVSDDSRTLPLLCTLILLHQVHLRSSGFRSRRLRSRFRQC